VPNVDTRHVAADASDGDRKADRVAHDLLRRIVRGDLPVGSVLPKESDLAEAYGTSRSVVREAMKLLEVHGVVKPVRRRGTCVLDPLASLSPEVLRALLRPRGAAIDVAFLEGVLEVRATLDVEMIGLAARRRTKADVARLERELGELRAAAVSPERFGRAVYTFGLAVAAATHNPIYTMLVNWNDAVVRELDVVFDAIRAAAAPYADGAGMLVERIAAGDEEGARDLVRTFHAWASPRLLATARIASGAPVAAIRKELT
jgi:DNA-binding FadR family transcriptional regulator